MADVAGRVHEFSLEQLRAAGADEERFPTADTLIKARALACRPGRMAPPWTWSAPVPSQLLQRRHVHTSALF